MKLEEAKERLEKYLSDIEKMGYRKLPNDEAISTVLQEIETLQKSNAELQKENEELKSRNEILECCKHVDSIEIIRAKLEECERWRNKIRKMIETLEEQEKAELEPKDVLVFPKDTAYLSAKVEYYHKKNILQDLLKEE